MGELNGERLPRCHVVFYLGRRTTLHGVPFETFHAHYRISADQNAAIERNNEAARAEWDGLATQLTKMAGTNATQLIDCAKQFSDESSWKTIKQSIVTLRSAVERQRTLEATK